MWWTVCSFTQELVNICSSMEVREKLLKPGREAIQPQAQGSGVSHPHSTVWEVTLHVSKYEWFQCIKKVDTPWNTGHIVVDLLHLILLKTPIAYRAIVK